MKVIVHSENYKQLQDEHDETLREMHNVKKALRKIQNEYDFKLQQRLDAEKHKAVGILRHIFQLVCYHVIHVKDVGIHEN